MAADLNVAQEARSLALLLHPHPHFGGNRFHPFIDGVFHRLPALAVTAIRFDFASAEPAVAREEAVAALEEASSQWPELPVVVAGYSFGAGIAAQLVDRRIVGWYLLAAPAVMLSDSPIGSDPRPKRLAVPELDQFSPPATMAETTTGWKATTVTTLPDTDHFLGFVGPIVDGALEWIDGIAGGGTARIRTG